MKIKVTVISVLLIAACGQQDESAGSAAVGESAAPPPVPPQEAAAQEPIREITNITGDLYRARNNNHYTIFLVTSSGTILADPINVEFSEWLKAQIAERFDSTVRYVLHSHHHFDHASGGAVFGDTAEFIGHENMIAALQAGLPANQAANDTNGDGVIQRNEALGGAQAQFDTIDANGDGAISGEEFNANIRTPDFGYSSTNVIMLGGKRVLMIHPGRVHSDDATVLVFPDERVAFGVDFVNIGQLGGRLAGSTVDEWVAALKVIADLDVDTVVPGHGIIGTPADIAAFRQFILDLDKSVAAGLAQGRSLEQLQADIKLEQYAEWTNFEQRLPSYIAEVYHLQTADSD